MNPTVGVDTVGGVHPHGHHDSFGDGGRLRLPRFVQGSGSGGCCWIRTMSMAAAAAATHAGGAIGIGIIDVVAVAVG